MIFPDGFFNHRRWAVKWVLLDHLCMTPVLQLFPNLHHHFVVAGVRIFYSYRFRHLFTYLSKLWAKLPNKNVMLRPATSLCSRDLLVGSNYHTGGDDTFSAASM